MILDIFSELQKARPWGAGHERAVIREAIDQAKLADALGFGCWWNVEHHGAQNHKMTSLPSRSFATMRPPLMVSSTKSWGHSAATVAGALRSAGDESSAAHATASRATTAVRLVSRTLVRFGSTSESVGATEAILGCTPPGSTRLEERDS